jgi:ABC-type lipopolysaccharide export system ATPase subunit
MAEQNFNQATKICERGYFIVHCQIAFVGTSHEELSNNEMVRKIYLGAPVRNQPVVNSS